jgi:hypothetical protein
MGPNETDLSVLLSYADVLSLMVPTSTTLLPPCPTLPPSLAYPIILKQLQSWEMRFRPDETDMEVPGKW